MSAAASHLLVLLAAVIYALGALLVKRAADFQIGVWRTAFCCNLVTALLFLPLLAWGGNIRADLWWQPLIVALCFVVGQWLTFFSLQHGDVSVTTPVLGIKILLVAIFVSVAGGEVLRPKLWLAAALATVGIALLNRSTTGTRRRAGLTILTAGLAAACYALFDVLVQHWSPTWGRGRFLPITLGLSGILSFAFIPRFSAPLRSVPRKAWPWLLGGATTIAFQSVIFVSVVATWGQAAQANVIYSSRGLCSVLLVWLVGRQFQNRESQSGGRVFAWRLAGASLMMCAIVLVFA
jgi:drug/metabolite transporter (DMT)-like permease